MNAGTADLLSYTSSARAIVRCAVKTCRTAHTIDFSTTVETITDVGRHVGDLRSVTIHGRTSSYRDRYDLTRIALARFTCTGCGGSKATFDVVRGSYSEAVRCGGRCRSAVGPSCDCECAGASHGSDHNSI